MAFVQQNGATADSSAATIATSLTGVASGNLIFVAVSNSDFAGTVTVTDTLSNTYTRIGSIIKDTTNGQDASIYYAKNVTGGSPTITATFSSSRAFRRIIAVEYSGLDTIAPLDQGTGQWVSTGTTSTDGVTSGSVTTTTDGQTIVGVVMDTAGVATQTAGTGFTKRGEYGELNEEDLVQSSAGSIAATWTFGTAHAYVAAIATFKAAGGGGAPAAKRLQLLGIGG